MSKNSARFAGTFSSHASLVNLSASRARDSIVALRARYYVLHIHITLFLVNWYWSLSQFYNVVDVNYISRKLLNLIWNEKGNSIYLRNTFWSWHSRSIFCTYFCNFLIIYMIKKNLSSSKYLKKEKNLLTVFKQTIFYFKAYFVSHIFWLKNVVFIFKSVFLKPKHKITSCQKIFYW